MSAPDTNTEKQTRRHRPALIGIAIAVLAGAVFFLLNMGAAVDDEGPLVEGNDSDASAFTGDDTVSPEVVE